MSNVKDRERSILLEARAQSASRVTWAGLFVNIVLTLFKYAAGVLGHSGAMLADATHSLSDLVTDVVVLLGFRIVQKPEDASHDFGHGKIETMLTLFCGFFLLLAGAGIFLHAAGTLADAMDGHELAVPGSIALVAALVSIVTKELLFQYTYRCGRRIESSAIMANAWHHRSDALSSIGTLCGIGGAMLLGERWRLLDPVAALIVSFFIGKVAWGMVWESLSELLECSLDEETEKRIVALIEENPSVRGVHQLRTRKIGFYMAIDAHILVPRHLSIVEAHDVATMAEKALEGAFGEHTIISLHVEPEPRRGTMHEEGVLEGERDGKGGL